MQNFTINVTGYRHEILTTQARKLLPACLIHSSRTTSFRNGTASEQQSVYDVFGCDRRRCRRTLDVRALDHPKRERASSRESRRRHHSSSTDDPSPVCESASLGRGAKQRFLAIAAPPTSMFGDTIVLVVVVTAFATRLDTLFVWRRAAVRVRRTMVRVTPGRRRTLAFRAFAAIKIVSHATFCLLARAHLFDATGVRHAWKRVGERAVHRWVPSR